MADHAETLIIAGISRKSQGIICWGSRIFSSLSMKAFSQSAQGVVCQ